jgi:hypothetical protein
MWAAWLFKLIGWRVDFQGLPSMQGVAIVYPHTSNWDFLYRHVKQMDHGHALIFLVQRHLIKDSFVWPLASLDWWSTH